MEWGFLVLLATLLQAGILSILLILVPLLFLPRRATRLRDRGATVVYFTCLGLGYLFIEVVYIQKFTLFLANPMFSVSVVIASFLVFSGLGSLCFGMRRAGGTASAGPRLSWLVGAVGGILGLLVGYGLVFPIIFAACMGWGTVWKVCLSVGLIAPLGFCMGIPFPFGLQRLHWQARDLTPWAYGINGYASVLSSLLATWIAISSGFQMVLLVAGGMYLLAAAALGRIFCGKPSPDNGGDRIFMSSPS